ncbi:hypothetical protein ACVWWN_006418 [Mycobacterium sp. URHB0021]|jgi:hypothetical protein
MKLQRNPLPYELILALVGGLMGLSGTAVSQHAVEAMPPPSI